MMDDEMAKCIDRIAEGIERISVVMTKPESKFKRIMELTGYSVTIVAVLSAIDMIRNWIIGG